METPHWNTPSKYLISGQATAQTINFNTETISWMPMGNISPSNSIASPTLQSFSRYSTGILTLSFVTDATVRNWAQNPSHPRARDLGPLVHRTSNHGIRSLPPKNQPLDVATQFLFPQVTHLLDTPSPAPLLVHPPSTGLRTRHHRHSLIPISTHVSHSSQPCSLPRPHRRGLKANG